MSAIGCALGGPGRRSGVAGQGGRMRETAGEMVIRVDFGRQARRHDPGAHSPTRPRESHASPSLTDTVTFGIKRPSVLHLLSFSSQTCSHATRDGTREFRHPAGPYGGRDRPLGSRRSAQFSAPPGSPLHIAGRTTLGTIHRTNRRPRPRRNKHRHSSPRSNHSTTRHHKCQQEGSQAITR